PLPGGGMLYHLDLYRIAGSASALAFGVDEFLDDPDSLALIEWPERIADIIPGDAIQVRIRHISDTEREISVTGNC
ncbi:MAG: tRNA (adenosine(37)-N6)-threonylcarbamoyltransferase complex ATPase subunit type 1 TsaE, partial [Victivallis vadensis]